jgi:hypothetical protein
LMKTISATMGRLGATVAGTDPCSTGGHPQTFKEKRRLQMNKFRFTLMALAIMAFTLMISSSAQAQATRTWVSGVGDDANPCSRTAPCKTFAGAISKTATGGEIDVLDPGGFGAVTITKSITIDGGPFEAGVLVSATNGIIINAGTANASTSVVALRNLDFNGVGTGLNGIRILNAQNVIVDHCQIYGFKGNPGRAISDERTQTSPVPMLFVNDCYIRDNVGGIAAGVVSAGSTRVVIDNTRIQGNSQTGVFANFGAVLMVRFCNISGNLADGVQIIGAGTQANVISSVITENQGIGANNVSGTQFSLADTSIINNLTGVSGIMTSFGNNNVRNNGGGNALPAPVGQQ